MITVKLYEDAERIMTEGLASIFHLEDVLRVAFLKRHCQLLLFLSDKMTDLDKRPLQLTSTADPTIRLNTNHNPTVEHSFAGEDFNHTTSYASLNVSDDDSRNYNNETSEDYCA